MEPLISVVVPAFNEGKYVAEALTSLQSQTYKNIEIIFVDDFSKDDTAQIAERVLGNGVTAYKIIRMKKNRGVSATRNAGLKEAKGYFVTFLDGDDYLLPHAIEALYKAAADREPAAAVTISGYRELDTATGKTRIHRINKAVTSAMQPDEITMSRILNKIPPEHSALYKRDFIAEHGITFNENCVNGEDCEFALKALSVSGRTAICHEIGYVYRVHERMTTRRPSETWQLRRYKDNTDAIGRTASFIMENSESAKLYDLCSSILVPLVQLRHFSYLAMKKDLAGFESMLSALDKKMIMNSRRSFIKKPEVHVRALTLLAFPKLYYRQYSKRIMHL